VSKFLFHAGKGARDPEEMRFRDSLKDKGVPKSQEILKAG